MPILSLHFTILAIREQRLDFQRSYESSDVSLTSDTYFTQCGSERAPHDPVYDGVHTWVETAEDGGPTQ